MRRQFLAMSAVLAVVGVCFGLATAADSATGGQYVGAWNGTWEGAGGSGRFDLTLTQGGDGKIAGGVSVGSDTGDYTAKFSTISIANNKLTAKYDYPPDEQGEVALTATFDGGKANGTWVLAPKGQDTAMANGTWTVTKK